MRRSVLVALSFALPISLSPAWAQDSDVDLVRDSADAFPCDAGASGVAYAPAQDTHGLLLFEDQWPQDGDLDFNDVVVSTHFMARTNAQGQVVALRATYNLLAAGGIFLNGLGLHLPVPRTAVASATVRVGSGAPSAVLLQPDAEATLHLADDVRGWLTAPPAGPAAPINAVAGQGVLTAHPVQVDITFTSPVALSMAEAPFDTFIFRTGNQGVQVHLPKYGGTAAMDTALFGSADDTSTATRFFTGTNGIPFALSLPITARYPNEGVAITDLYPDLIGFAQSGGTSNQDFATSTVVAAKGFAAAPAPSFVAGGDAFTVDTTCYPPFAQHPDLLEYVSFRSSAELGRFTSTNVTVASEGTRFGADDSRVNLPGAAPNKGTLAAWVRIDGEGTGPSVMRMMFNFSYNSRFYIRYRTSTHQLNTGLDQSIPTWSTTLPYQQWFHLAVSKRTDGTASVYINGVRRESLGYTESTNDNFGGTGRVGPINDPNGKGRITVRDFYIFKAPLSDGEVSSLYTQTTSP